MLKLERQTWKNTIFITTRSREKLFSKYFVIALGIALTLHLSALSLFQVRNLILGSPFQFAPLQVETPIKIEKASTAKLTSFPVPISTHMSIDDLESGWTPLISLDTHQENPISLDFLSSEPVSQPTHWPFVQLSLSGEIERFVIKERSEIFLKRGLWNASEGDVVEAVFEVKIDPTRGKIIWYRIKNPVQNREINLLAEQLLLSLRFEPGDPFEKRYYDGQVRLSIIPSILREMKK